jgi:hypothetical protein
VFSESDVLAMSERLAKTTASLFFPIYGSTIAAEEENASLSTNKTREWDGKGGR